MKKTYRLFSVLLILGLMFTIEPSYSTDNFNASAIELLNPNLKLASIDFEPRNASYDYTGKPIDPVFSVHLNGIVEPSEYTYAIISTDDKNLGTSAGMYPGKVTIEIKGLGSESSGYYGSQTVSFNIEKTDGLKAENINISLTSSESSFDLNTILLNKSDCGNRSYSLGSLTDENDILSEVSINGSTLNYSASGKNGKAEQIITITTDNYKDINVKVAFETTGANYVRGDVNDDGVFSVADVILLQKWLVALPDATLANWKAADLCEDDRLNVFDLCIMKKELLNGKVTMKEENISMNTVPENMPVIVDDYGEITDDMKSMLWETVETKYPNVDFSDFTFVYEPEHHLSHYFNGWCFSIYYQDILLHGYGNIGMYDNVYAAIVNEKDNCKSVDINFIVDPMLFNKIDLSMSCLSKEEVISKDMYVNEPELIIYIDNDDKFLPKLAYRAINVNENGEYIIDAVTGDTIEYIPYYVT